MKFPACTYRASVKALIVKDGKLLMMQGEGKGDEWELPGGGLEHGESFADCLQRELMEDIASTPKTITGPIAVWPLVHPGTKKPYMHIICAVTLGHKIPTELPDGISTAYIDIDSLKHITMAPFLEPLRYQLISLVTVQSGA